MFVIFGIAKVVHQDLGDTIRNLSIHPVQSLVDTVWEESLLPEKSFQCWLKALSFQTNLRKKTRQSMSLGFCLYSRQHLPATHTYVLIIKQAASEHDRNPSRKLFV